MPNKVVVTIGRQFGSGAREIGRLLAGELDIPYYDKELLRIAAQESGLDQRFLESRDETGMSSLLYAIVMGTGRNYLGMQDGYSVDALARKAQYQAVRYVASKGGCVIVGRCADYVLQDNQNLTRVFVAADDQDRAAHISQRDGVNLDEAQKKMRRIDKERSMYYFSNTEQQWGNAANYDLCINTSRLGISGSVKLIRTFIDGCQKVRSCDKTVKA